MQLTRTIEIAPHASTVVITPAAAEDEYAVRHLFGALHAYNATLEPRFVLEAGWETLLAEHLSRERATGSSLTLLAWDTVEPIGLAMVASHTDGPLFRHRQWVELTALYVVPAARGSGVAGRLLAAARSWAKAEGHTELRLYVTAANHRARRFYAGSGLRPLQEIWATGV